jgi:hypothetical protein
MVDEYRAVRFCASCDRMTLGTAWATEQIALWRCGDCGTEYVPEENDE